MLDKIIQTTIELVKIPSVSHDISQLDEIIDYVISSFKEYKCHIQRFVSEDKPSVVISNSNTKEYDIIFCGHLDVVEGLGEQFSPYIESDKLYGRGAGDMKGGCAVMIELMKYLLNIGYKDKKVSLMLTSDEEIGGQNGVKYLLSQGYRGRVVFIPDGGDLNTVVLGAKGIVRLSLSSHEQGGHASRPWLHPNPIENILHFYKALQKEISVDKKDDENYWYTTAVMTIINAGSVSNAIPSEANATFSIRYTEWFTCNKIENICRELAKKNNCTIDQFSIGNLFSVSKEDIYLDRYISIIKEKTGGVHLSYEHGATDGKHFMDYKDMTVLINRPHCEHIHGLGEFVVVKELEILYDMYLSFLLSK